MNQVHELFPSLFADSKSNFVRKFNSHSASANHVQKTCRPATHAAGVMDVARANELKDNGGKGALIKKQARQVYNTIHFVYVY